MVTTRAQARDVAATLASGRSLRVVLTRLGGAVLVAALLAALLLVDHAVVLARAEQFVAWVHAQGARGVLALIGVHALAVALCFPATIVFEWGAGFTFGVWRGAAIVAASKTLGGLLGFALGRTLLHSWAAAAVARSRRWSHVFEQIGADGLRFALLLRLSPVPSWVANYGLALTPLRYAPFVLATLVGQVPFVLNNVYTGSLVHSVAHIASAGSSGGGGDADETNYVKLAFMATGFLAMGFVTRALVQYITAQLPELEADADEADKRAAHERSNDSREQEEARPTLRKRSTRSPSRRSPSRRSPAASRRSPATSRRSPAASRRSPSASRRSASASRRSPSASRRKTKTQ